ncbi:TIGR00282 family metallophosphoesterase [Salisediminibacterium halotolerans]|uniref:TIGR00282 family metallophosphoesterase n=1 Tax=Salisediminibacterium halotolerans TaxID=517425 RepID=A0A1H9QCG6_9BACI|nr:TIGR00282 family metallophosphoesterase [Salisediminibacterium haloalkalitolerans]SER57579.1 hypothetical protein SAMN05444126_102198 [Salisediminibacterium haloalkalitolerans]
MKLLFIGDVYGSPGREAVKEYLPKLKRKHRPDITVVNAENAAAGKGLTKKIYNELKETGADAFTMGNHMWDKKEIFDFIDDVDDIARPINYPDNNPGGGIVKKKVGNKTIAIINAQGRTFMPPADCPFRKLEETVTEVRKETPFIFIDFHAEATSEKQAIGWYLDGQVSALAGTHTHVPTADERLLHNGTAFITDVGMTGPFDGILGTNRNIIIRRFLSNLPERFEVQEGRLQLNGVLIDIDDASGLAKRIKRIQINEDRPFFD